MPPVIPDFCYYEALSVEKSATREEIVSSYRNLARIHHPDKNPNDANSTARFQRIQAAHETLSDDAKRQRYDNLVANPPGSRNYRPFFDEEEDDDEDDDSYQPAFNFFFQHGYFYFNGGSSYERRQTEQQAEYWARQARQEEDLRQQAREEKKKREEAEVKRREQREADRKQREEAVKEEFEKREKVERIEQDKIWAEQMPKSEAEKQTSCLHSAVWAKVQLTKKCKCEACGQKRGMTVFTCPYCSLQCCQLCINRFKERRERLGTKGRK